MPAELLVGTGLTIGLLVAVFAYAGRVRGWYRYTPGPSRPGVGWSPDRGESADGGWLASTRTWIAVFFLVVVAGVAGVFLLTADVIPAAGTVMLGAIGALVVANLVGGVYLLARQRGHSSAAATMASATASGAVFLVLVVLQLVVLG